MSREVRIKPEGQMRGGMSTRYSQGWFRGTLEQREIEERKYHINGVTYREITDLIESNGRLALRFNIYPIITMSLSLLNEEFFYIRPIGLKLRWSRFQIWAGGARILLIWEGAQAQALIKKIMIYLSSEKKTKAIRMLKWIPKGGRTKEIKEDPQSIDAIW